MALLLHRKQTVQFAAQRFKESDLNCHSPALLAHEEGGIEMGMFPMKKKPSLLQKMGLSRPKTPDDREDLSPFEKRLKMVNRARLVNQPGLGGPVFKNRQSETEA